jgi:hypothetical protein
MSAVGLSPEQVQDLADRLRGASAELAASRGAISSAVAVAWWSGGRADAFRSDWHGSLSPRLLRASEILEIAAAEAIRQRAQQLHTSDTGASFGPGSGFSAGQLGGGDGPGDAWWQDPTVRELRRAVFASARSYSVGKWVVAGRSAKTALEVSAHLKNAPLWNNSGAANRLVKYAPRLRPIVSSPLARGASRFGGAALSGYATVRGVQNLIEQGDPVDAFRADPGSYASDVAGTVFNASSTAFFIAPNPVTGTILVVSGVVYLGTEIWDHWDEISDFAGDAWDLAGDFHNAHMRALDAVGDVVGDVAGDVASGFADAVTFWN